MIGNMAGSKMAMGVRKTDLVAIFRYLLKEGLSFRLSVFRDSCLDQEGDFLLIRFVQYLMDIVTKLVGIVEAAPV